MAQITDTTGGETTTPKRRRRKARQRQVTTSRSGAGAGMGSMQGLGTNQGGLPNLTAEQAYQLGIRHGCELGGVSWPALVKR